MSTTVPALAANGGDPVAVATTHSSDARNSAGDFRGGSPLSWKQSVRYGLAFQYPTGDRNDDQRLQSALRHLDRSLNPSYWLDGYTLAARDGKKVFEEESKAVKDLAKIRSIDVSYYIESLVSIDRQLAQHAMGIAWAVADDAGCTNLPSLRRGDRHRSDTATRDCEKVARELDKAVEEMARGYDEYLDGDFDKAIDRYRKAWERAAKALRYFPTR